MGKKTYVDILVAVAICALLLITSVILGVIGAKGATANSKSLHEKTCYALSAAAKTLNVTLPIEINDHTTLHSMLVICSAKMVVYTKVLDVHEDELEKGWLAGMRVAWNATMCAAPTIKDMNKRDWSFIDQIYFADGAIYHVIANCKVKVAKKKRRRRKKRRRAVKKK